MHNLLAQMGPVDLDSGHFQAADRGGTYADWASVGLDYLLGSGDR